MARTKFTAKKQKEEKKNPDYVEKIKQKSKGIKKMTADSTRSNTRYVHDDWLTSSEEEETTQQQHQQQHPPERTLNQIIEQELEEDQRSHSSFQPLTPENQGTGLFADYEEEQKQENQLIETEIMEDKTSLKFENDLMKSIAEKTHKNPKPYVFKKAETVKDLDSHTEIMDLTVDLQEKGKSMKKEKLKNMCKSVGEFLCKKNDCREWCEYAITPIIVNYKKGKMDLPLAINEICGAVNNQCNFRNNIVGDFVLNLQEPLAHTLQDRGELLNSNLTLNRQLEEKKEMLRAMENITHRLREDLRVLSTGYNALYNAFGQLLPEERCCLCLTDLLSKVLENGELDSIKVTGCNHYFHLTCFQQWPVHCAVCRANVQDPNAGRVIPLIRGDRR